MILEGTSVIALSPCELEALLPAVRRIAEEAARRILNVYASDIAVTLKSDCSPLTQADLASHLAITEGLREITPGIPVVSEEAESLPFAERSQWSRYWLVDPLDGTKDFIKRNGEFTVNIALIEQHQATLGVVHVPVTQVCYFAAKGVGAFKAEPPAQEPTRLKTKRADADGFVVCRSRSHGSEATQAFINRLPKPVTSISCGSSLKLCLVAEGRADIYPRFGLTSEWDTAAAQCIIEQAGGIVTDMALAPITYNAKANILNPFFLAIADPSYPWAEYLPAVPTG